MRNKLPLITGFLAAGLAACAAFCSVTGLSQLFAGAALTVIIIASFLEATKIVLTIVLHNHAKQLSVAIRTYCTIGVIALVMVTSLGIYGFLSNGYQRTANKLELHTGEVGVLEVKKGMFEKSIFDNQAIVANKNKRIETLTNLRSRQETRLDSARSSRNKDRARKDIAESNMEIQKLTNDIDIINTKNAALTDSVNVYTAKILGLNASSSVTAEVGPLKYLSALTGKSMDSIVNYIILVLIFLFDPMAIILVIVTSRLIQVYKEGKKSELIDKTKLEPTPIVSEELQTVSEHAVKEQPEEIHEEQGSISEQEQVPPSAHISQEAFKELLSNKKKKLEEQKETYSELLRIFYRNGDVQEGGELPSYPEFSTMVNLEKYPPDTIKKFLTLANYLNISKASKDSKIALKSYPDAMITLQNYLSLEVN